CNVATSRLRCDQWLNLPKRKPRKSSRATSCECASRQTRSEHSKTRQTVLDWSYPRGYANWRSGRQEPCQNHSRRPILKFGPGGELRTRDFPLSRRVLCPLSYPRAFVTSDLAVGFSLVLPAQLHVRLAPYHSFVGIGAPALRDRVFTPPVS